MPTTTERFVTVDQAIEGAQFAAELWTDTAKTSLALLGLATAAAAHLAFAAEGATGVAEAAGESLPEGIVLEGTAEWAAADAARAATEILDAEGNLVYVITDMPE